MSDLPTITMTSSPVDLSGTTVVKFLSDGDPTAEGIRKLDEETAGAVSRAIKAVSFKPKRRSILDILAPSGMRANRLLIVGLGDNGTLSEWDWMEIGGAVRGKIGGKAAQVDAIFDGNGGDANAHEAFALGFALRSYSFRKYKTSIKKHSSGNNASDDDSDNASQPSLNMVIGDGGARSASTQPPGQALGEAVYFARDLVNEPANVLTPKEFANRIRGLAAHGLEIEILDDAAMRALGMNALLSVGLGSAQPSFTAIIKWDGLKNKATASDGSLVFVGKGVCFDTGGISIKPAQGMEDMKGDTAGAAAVVGAMMALASRNAPVRATGIVGLVENMPSGTAQRPGDIITAASGQTIEVLNTDAEGRLVLADLLWYAQQHLAPKAMISLATLTGAIIVALGKENAGLFSNTDALASQLADAGSATGELVWRMPLSKKYDKMIDSKNADMKNIGGRDAGSITAAQFLQRFVNDGMAWAHIDIAGTGMAVASSDINTSWAPGFGVRLLDRLSSKFFE